MVKTIKGSFQNVIYILDHVKKILIFLALIIVFQFDQLKIIMIYMRKKIKKVFKISNTMKLYSVNNQGYLYNRRQLESNFKYELSRKFIKEYLMLDDSI